MLHFKCQIAHDASTDCEKCHILQIVLNIYAMKFVFNLPLQAFSTGYLLVISVFTMCNTYII